MSDIPTYYRAALRRYDQYMHPTWPVATSVALGDYGILAAGRFQRKGNLADWQFQVQAKTDSRMPELLLNGEHTHSSDMAPQIIVEHSKVLGEGKARLNFTAAEQVSLVAADVCSHRLVNLAEAETCIRQLQRCQAWPANYSLITTVVEAQAHILAIAAGGTRRGHLQFKIQGDPTTSLVELLRAKVPLTYRGERNVQAVHRVAQASPLWFGIHQLRTVSVFIGGNGIGTLQPIQNAGGLFRNYQQTGTASGSVYVPATSVTRDLASTTRLVPIPVTA